MTSFETLSSTWQRSQREALSKVDALYEKLSAGGRENIFIHLLSQDEARKEVEKAYSSHAAGSLAGMLIAVKNNIDVAGFDTTAACPGFSYRPAEDSEAVAALRAEGAVIIGVTNLDQFATGLVGTRSPYGAVSDSRVLERISGGSSSGSAVSVAFDLVDAALGTDTAGSGRVPAGLQGIVGIKPTLGTISSLGLVPACASYDTITVFAKDLPQARAVAAVVAKTGRRTRPKDLKLSAPLHPVIGIPRELPALSDTWKLEFERAVSRLADLGFETKAIDLAPSLEAAKMLYESALVAERTESVGTFISEHADDPDAVGIDPVVASIVESGSKFSAVEVLRAQRELQRKKVKALEQWEGVDAVMVPTAPFHPDISTVASDPIAVNSAMGTYTNFCNLFDLCAIAVPSSEAPDGGTLGSKLPAQFGVTLLAATFEDGVIDDIAGRFLGLEENQATWMTTTSEDAQQLVSLAVFGAHLRDQPLNVEMRAHGAAFIGEIETTDNYSLYALNTVPPKPGLVVVQEGGAAIKGEEWLISKAELGEFLSNLPAPMTLGLVTLSNGKTVVGFSCQPSALEDATDITALGGWRPYVYKG
ncbi:MULTISPECIES: allophanate hydrolase [Corynebacterium]|uniref:allophanate hydrolase n=1 Tax=Corynebacterium TaxID=1716 RepID=UPI002579B8C2|nr:MULTISPECIES: allophanate hydrolase [Corynebacterium]